MNQKRKTKSGSSTVSKFVKNIIWLSQFSRVARKKGI